MPAFTAHYRSADSSGERAKGSFEFESDSRLGSKANSHDARVRMLELFGNEALSWTIDRIERKTSSRSGSSTADGQLELDFRDPVEVKRRRKRSVKRGVVG